MCQEFFNQIPRWGKFLLIGALTIWLIGLGLDKLLQAGINLNNLRHWQPPQPNINTITISGEGKEMAIPDIGVINLSVESRGSSVAAVQADNTKKMNEIVGFLKSQDIEKKDMQTTQYNLQPIYRYEPNTGKQYLDGYQLAQTVTVKVRQLDRVGDIMGGATDRGADQIGQLTFTIDDPEKLQAAARLKAVKNARAKASALAQAAGVKLGKVKSFSENINSPMPYPMYYSRDLAIGGEAKSAPPQIEAGSQEIAVSVSISFEIE